MTSSTIHPRVGPEHSALPDHHSVAGDRVEAGENFVVTRNGVAVADLVPHQPRDRPPTFPKTRALVRGRRETTWTVADREAWLEDIRGTDRFLDDDPLESNA